MMLLNAICWVPMIIILCGIHKLVNKLYKEYLLGLPDKLYANDKEIVIGQAYGSKCHAAIFCCDTYR